MIVVEGHSDDIVFVEGDITEEFDASPALYSDDPAGGLLGFSDGTLLRVTFTAGVWRITPIMRGPALIKVEQADESAEEGTDRAELSGGVWVLFGHLHAMVPLINRTMA